MVEKFIERICPNCGELCDNYEITKALLGPGVHINMMCPNKHKWTEFYTLTYTGFYWNNKMYDSYGQEVSKEDSK